MKLNGFNKKFLTGINMSAENFNGQVSGVNLEHSRIIALSDMKLLNLIHFNLDWYFLLFTTLKVDVA